QADWWAKEHGQPVSPELSAQRALTCSKCPKNDKKSIDAWFLEPAAKLIRKTMEIRTDLDLKTPHDDLIHICSVCHCPPKSAVHEPLEIKKKHMTAQEMSELW